MKKTILFALLAHSIAMYGETITIADSKTCPIGSNRCNVSKKIAAVLGVAGLMGLSSGVTWFVMKYKTLARFFKKFTGIGGLVALCEDDYNLPGKYIFVTKAEGCNMFTIMPNQGTDSNRKKETSRQLNLLARDLKRVQWFSDCIKKVELINYNGNRAVQITFAD